MSEDKAADKPDQKELMRRAIEAKKNRQHVGGTADAGNRGIGPASSSNKTKKMFKRKSGSA
ncbi:MAG: hypothetical protein F2563_03470 [Actinobacteria bacterium]|jgi:hypothetical protein|uniref:Unannotated protein n=1 Tax=freshwater metagenome TaxID=449393 RepID=A0A6J6EYF2_9ZZZZ|nr:hypothetical protein [Actinomycetota bacterium]